MLLATGQEKSVSSQALPIMLPVLFLLPITCGGTVFWITLIVVNGTVVFRTPCEVFVNCLNEGPFTNAHMPTLLCLTLFYSSVIISDSCLMLVFESV